MSSVSRQTLRVPQVTLLRDPSQELCSTAQMPKPLWTDLVETVVMSANRLSVVVGWTDLVEAVKAKGQGSQRWGKYARWWNLPLLARLDPRPGPLPRPVGKALLDPWRRVNRPVT